MNVSRLGNRWVFLGALATLFTVVALLVGTTPPRNDTPYALDGNGKDGLHAWVLLIGSFGARIEHNAKPLTDRLDVVVDLGNQYQGNQTAEIHRWVRQGGRLVVFGTSSSLAPGGESDFASGVIQRRCVYANTVGVLHIDPGGVKLVDPKGSDVACFGSGRGAFLTVKRVGRGEVIQLASLDVFTNQRIDRQQNASLAVRLFSGNTTSVRIIEAAGKASPISLIGDNVWFFLLEALVALGLWVLAKARRLGKPITERLPVVVPGSELVVAMGDIYQRGNHRQHSADQLSATLARDLRDVIGSPERDPERLAELASARFDVDPIVMKRLLQPFISHDGELLDYARAVAHFRSEVQDVTRRANV